MTDELVADHLYLDLCDRKVRFKVDMNVKIGDRKVLFKVIKQHENLTAHQKLLGERFAQKKMLNQCETEVILTKWRGQLIATVNGWNTICNAYHVPFELYPKIRTALK